MNISVCAQTILPFLSSKRLLVDVYQPAAVFQNARFAFVMILKRIFHECIVTCQMR